MSDVIRRIIQKSIPRPIRNALRDPLATIRWSWQEATHSLRPPSSITVRDDWEIRCHPSSLVPFELFRNDEESRLELDSFIKFTSINMVFYDIGSHHGIFSLAAFRYGGVGSRVVAVDPSPTAMRTLNYNLKIAGLSESVYCIESAVGSESGSTEMLESGAGGWFFFHGVDDARPDARVVRQVTLSELIQLTGLVPTHIKIDVEGFEREVIEGGQTVLREYRPIVLLELHSKIMRQRGHRPEAVLTRLVECGYGSILRHGRPISPADAVQPSVARLVCLPDSRL